VPIHKSLAPLVDGGENQERIQFREKVVEKKDGSGRRRATLLCTDLHKNPERGSRKRRAKPPITITRTRGKEGGGSRQSDLPTRVGHNPPWFSKPRDALDRMAFVGLVSPNTEQVTP